MMRRKGFLSQLPRKFALILTLAVILVFGVGNLDVIEVHAETVTEDGFNYTVVKNQYVRIGSYRGEGGLVGIPPYIEGYPVKEIGYNSFHGKTAITSLVIPDTVEKIWANAFYNCSNIEKIYGLKNIKYIGAQAFYGVGDPEKGHHIDITITSKTVEFENDELSFCPETFIIHCYKNSTVDRLYKNNENAMLVYITEPTPGTETGDDSQTGSGDTGSSSGGSSNSGGSGNTLPNTADDDHRKVLKLIFAVSVFCGVSAYKLRRRIV